MTTKTENRRHPLDLDIKLMEVAEYGMTESSSLAILKAVRDKFEDMSDAIDWINSYTGEGEKDG